MHQPCSVAFRYLVVAQCVAPSCGHFSIVRDCCVLTYTLAQEIDMRHLRSDKNHKIETNKKKFAGVAEMPMLVKTISSLSSQSQINSDMFM